MAVPTIYVVFRADTGSTRWEVRREGDDRPLSTHATQAEAVVAGSTVSKREGAELVVHDRSEASRTLSPYHLAVNDVEYRTLVYPPGERSTPLREFRTSSPLPLRAGAYYVHVGDSERDGPKQVYRIRAVMVDLYSEPSGRVMHTTSIHTDSVEAKGGPRVATRRSREGDPSSPALGGKPSEDHEASP